MYLSCCVDESNRQQNNFLEMAWNESSPTSRYHQPHVESCIGVAESSWLTWTTIANLTSTISTLVSSTTTISSERVERERENEMLEGRRCFNFEMEYNMQIQVQMHGPPMPPTVDPLPLPILSPIPFLPIYSRKTLCFVKSPDYSNTLRPASIPPHEGSRTWHPDRSP